MSGVVTFAVEPFEPAFAEAGPLMDMHWQEIAKNKALLTLNPDVERYKTIEKILLLIVARCEGRMVGYFLWLLVTHPHYKHVTVAEEDLHFMHPDYRRGWNGYNLVKAACRAAIEKGAQLLTIREKFGHEHPALMERLGFKTTDIVYTCSAKEFS